ncbi:hypothetical protein [Actinoplanes sp. L3-i22]|uniref:hypothetical protein n=1 Tax=Actinoplanes sp. L3-i22 TaxID=2836373 RepID=UPI001C769758|nr:hypothetical protein [Actinoplanes sp. L3-i22]BCY05417.1 hypothetical protein L3i22_005050 [Actinoplanes sp. L3-i22]
MRVASLRWIGATTLIATVALGVAAPAFAATTEPHYRISPSLEAYTDSAVPDVTEYYPSGGETPIGTRVDQDGVTHTTRAYVSFDLGSINKSRFQQAIVVLPDYGKSCEDGSTPGERDVTVRQTQPFADNTWANPPALTGAAVRATADACQTATADLTTMVSRALKRGESSIFVEIRVRGAREAKAKFARWLRFNDTRLEVNLVNRAPDKPVDLKINDQDNTCTGDFVTNTDLSAYARMSDPDTSPWDSLSSEFQWWPAADPSDVHSMPAGGTSSGWDGQFGIGSIPGRTLADGGYAWRARTFDTREYSAWSDVCSFTIDRTPPATVPTVGSPEYPENSAAPVGGAYRSGTFLFTANGDPTVVRFAYGQDGYIQNTVAADQAGGAAVVTWYPTASGKHTLTVWGLDAAGNRSEPRQYAINVA